MRHNVWAVLNGHAVQDAAVGRAKSLPPSTLPSSADWIGKLFLCYVLFSLKKSFLLPLFKSISLTLLVAISWCRVLTQPAAWTPFFHLLFCVTLHMHILWNTTVSLILCLFIYLSFTPPNPFSIPVSLYSPQYILNLDLEKIWLVWGTRGTLRLFLHYPNKDS